MSNLLEFLTMPQNFDLLTMSQNMDILTKTNFEVNKTIIKMARYFFLIIFLILNSGDLKNSELYA